MRLRYFVLVLLTSAIGLLGSAGPSVAIPSPAHSTVPARLVVCPAGDVAYVVTVRDLANNPVVGCEVTLDFGACPGFAVCADCCAGLDVDRTARRVTAFSGMDGTAAFPFKLGPCPSVSVNVYACLCLIGQTKVASFDQDGDLEVTAADAIAVLGLLGTATTGADFDGDGIVTQADLDLLVDQHGGHTCANVVPARRSTWGAVKILYR